jgi:hydroxyquinol 1,2-dioxygenase
MRNFDENTITAAVLERFEHAKTARAHYVSEALVRHLHAFIREPTFEEWREAIVFLTSVGKKCSDTRQEFILLSDTLGVSMLVDAINHRMPKGATETTVLGPFFVESAPETPLGADISPGMPGEPLFVQGSVSTVGGDPLPGAIVDIWHSDKDGYYDVQHYDEAARPRCERASARTRPDASGSGQSSPASIPFPTTGRSATCSGRRAAILSTAHVHFMIASPGYETLVTHVFIDGDKYLDSDVVFGVKDSLIRKLERRAAGLEAAGKRVDHPFAVMTYDYVLAPRGTG